MSDTLDDRLARLRPIVEARARATDGGAGQVILFFSFTDGSARATVLTATGVDFAAAWAIGAEQLRKAGERCAWLRVDWVEAVEPTTWGAFRAQLGRFKRNYFRLGIALDADFKAAFLEVELNANAMLYGGARLDHAVLNEKNFRIYARRRHRLETLDFPDDGHIWVFSTHAAFTEKGDARAYLLEGEGGQRGAANDRSAGGGRRRAADRGGQQISRRTGPGRWALSLWLAPLLRPPHPRL